jgi:ABC-type branched-subunit amino acid transport system ATPase component
MVAVARAMMAKPKMLLLDEPSMGLAPQLVAEIFNIVKELNNKGGREHFVIPAKYQYCSQKLRLRIHPRNRLYQT